MSQLQVDDGVLSSEADRCNRIGDRCKMTYIINVICDMRRG
jgi:hypothetical protein